MNEPEVQPNFEAVHDPLVPEGPKQPVITDAIRQDNPSESEAGTEVVIYNEPQELPEHTNFHIIMYLFMIIASELVGKIIFGAMIIHLNHSDKKTFEVLALFLVIFHIWKIGLNMFFLIGYGNRVPEFRSTYILDMVLSIGYICVFWSLFMYLNGKIDAASLPLFVIPHIILTLIRFCVGMALDTPFMPISLFAFVESLEILYISLKISNPSGHSDWTWILLYFYILCILLLILAYLLAVILLVLLIVLLFKPDIFREADSMSLLLVFGIIFYVIWNGFVYYYLLSGFHMMMTDNQIGPGKSASAIVTRLTVISYVMVICGIITLIILILFLIYLKETLMRMLNQNKANQISLQSFAKGLNLGVTQQSGNYFKKKDEKDVEQPEGGHNPEIGTCIICCDKQSEVMIHPCGHSGICKDCMTECLKRSDKCPHCKQPMDKIYLIYFDEEKKTYMAKGALKFKKIG